MLGFKHIIEHDDIESYQSDIKLTRYLVTEHYLVNDNPEFQEISIEHQQLL